MTTAAWRLECPACGAVDENFETVCPRCGGLLELVRVKLWEAPEVIVERFDDRLRHLTGVEHSGVWRYREFLFEADLANIVAFPEGNTPLLRDARVSAHAMLDRLWIKHEGFNPTGSFKDRGMTTGVTRAKELGARAVACASTGNTSASLAAYAARAGIPAFVFVPAGKVAQGKLTQTLAYGARTVLINGDFDACLTLVKAAAARTGVYLLNSVNPYRIEGQKAIAIELLHQLGWDAPDWIALPAGNLGNTAALGKALREMADAKLIRKTPRVLCVQAAGAAPFAASYDTGFATFHAVHAETVASAIRIGNPASLERAIRTIRSTNGAVLAVDDDQILRAKGVIDAAGIGCEPASAASVAGVRAAVGSGLIAPHESVVAILTGHVLKDPGILMSMPGEGGPPPGNRPVEIDSSPAAIESLLREATA